MRALPRVLVIAALVAGVAALAAVAFGVGGRGYEVTARFRDAGQLVKGGDVQVAGGRVGTIAEIRLGDDGIAEIVMDLDEELEPLRRGTVAQIRSLGLSGIANRFVDLRPGSGAPIPDGGRLELPETQWIVDLDAVLTSLDPATRKRLQGLVRSGGRLFEGTAARDGNRVLKYLNPAVSEGRALARELTRDREALETLVTTGAETARVVAAHDDSLGRGLGATATALRAIADERASLDGLLRRAPAGFAEMGRSLDSIGRTFAVTRPLLGELSAAAPALAGLARALPPAGEAARPVLADLRGTLPALNATLRRLPPLARAARPALGSATSALVRLTPILRGLRPYAPDLIAGVFLGFGGTAGANYDANGHFGRIAISGLGAGAPGLGSLLTATGAVGPLMPTTGFANRCPGAGAQVAPDGSNAIVQDPSICNPAQRRP